MDKDIINKNDKGEYHGYNELYFYGLLIFRGISKNNKDIAYQEYHNIEETRFYIN